MQIFLSYAHEEIATQFISRLKAHLATFQIPAWVDFMDIAPGAAWMASIDDAIRSSFAAVVVLTPASYRSEYVTYEWAFALGAKVPVCPLLLQPAGLHPRLQSLQWIDCTRNEQQGLNQVGRWLEPLVPYEQKRVRDLAHVLNRGNADEKERGITQLVQMKSADAQELVSDLFNKAIDALALAESEADAEEAARQLLALDRAGVKSVHARVHWLQQQTKLSEFSSIAAKEVMRKTRAFNV